MNGPHLWDGDTLSACRSLQEVVPLCFHGAREHFCESATKHAGFVRLFLLSHARFNCVQLYLDEHPQHPKPKADTDSDRPVGDSAKDASKLRAESLGLRNWSKRS